MKKQEVEKLLQKISNQRMFGETDKALANLHLLNNEFPKDKKYLGLLASTYMDAEADDEAREYCEKALAIDPNYPEAHEILGLLAEKKNETEKAEEYYRKSIAHDIYFRNGHLRLLLLHYTKSNYQAVVKETEFMLQNFDKERNSYTPERKRKIYAEWLVLVYARGTSALIRLGQYEKAIGYINEKIQFSKTYIKDIYQFHREDEKLYKLYYLQGNKKKVAEYENRWLNHYKVPLSKIVGMQKDVEQGYIESMNIDNYTIDENGHLV